MINRLLGLAIFVGTISHAGLIAAEPAPELTWTDIRDLGIEGQGWTDTLSSHGA